MHLPTMAFPAVSIVIGTIIVSGVTSILLHNQNLYLWHFSGLLCCVGSVFLIFVTIGCLYLWKDQELSNPRMEPSFSLSYVRVAFLASVCVYILFPGLAALDKSIFLWLYPLVGLEKLIVYSGLLILKWRINGVNMFVCIKRFFIIYIIFLCIAESLFFANIYHKVFSPTNEVLAAIIPYSILGTIPLGLLLNALVPAYIRWVDRCTNARESY